MDEAKEADSATRYRLEQVLEEARVVLPGAQALIGFQFIVTFNETFSTMPIDLRVAHFVALALVTICTALLVTIPAVHRIGFDGRIVEQFVTIAARLLTVALIPLAAGIATDLYVAFSHSFKDHWLGAVAGTVCAAILFGLWYGAPLLVRRTRKN
jgi:hypothetical protein